MDSSVPPCSARADAEKDQVDGPESSMQHNVPRMYLVLTNISKRPNVRSLLLTAAAFGCAGVFVVGQRNFDMSPDGPDLPRQLKACVQNGSMTITRFEKWQDCVQHLREHRIQLVGVEIHGQAKNLEDFCAQEPSTDKAFFMGNEGQGLQAKHMDSCDSFVIISQYGGGTASLNVNVAASIVLHRFHDYQRRKQIGGDASGAS